MRGLWCCLVLASAPALCQSQVCAPAGDHSDSITINFILTPPAKAIEASRATDYLLLAGAIRDHLAPPIAVELPHWPGTVIRRFDDMEMSNSQQFGVDGDLEFVLDTLGRLVPTTESSHSGSSLLDGELLDALRAADTAGDLAFVPAILRGTRHIVALHVSASSVPISQSVVFASYHSAVNFVDTPPVRLSGPQARYPQAALIQRIPETVVLQFVVDPSGRPEPASIQLIKAGYQEFVESAIQAIRATAFRPGLAGGCPVRVLVQTSVVFKIGGR